jgi:hypothetical protein
MAVRACVFVGPTLRPDDLAAASDIAVLPPAAQGDIYRLAQRRPQAIGIIDGYFEGVLAVWHKELLWAMAEGIHVFGSASMGALRAAELHPFGMVGVGRIFEAYRDGELEDDDEVAVIHGPPETGYVALSEAMVNIHRTLDEAAGDSVIAPATRDCLIRIAKELFYHDRTFDHLLDRAAEQSVSPGELQALREWLPQGGVDQKREDALAMLEAMQALLARDPQPMRVRYALEWTRMWDDATAAAAASRAGATIGWVAHDRILAELRLEADTYAAVRDRALLRHLAGREADRRRQSVDAAAARELLARLRVRHRLFTPAELDRWLADNDLEADRLEWLLRREAQLRAIMSMATPDDLLDELRLRNDYGRLAERARCKQDLLCALGLDHPTPEDLGVLPVQLLAWHCKTRLGQPLPDDVDAAARELGFEDQAELYRALLREWLYCREEHRSSEPPGARPAGSLRRKGCREE